MYSTALRTLTLLGIISLSSTLQSGYSLNTRPATGTSFHALGRLDLSNSFWDLVLHLQIPDNTNFGQPVIPKLDCTSFGQTKSFYNRSALANFRPKNSGGLDKVQRHQFACQHLAELMSLMHARRSKVILEVQNSFDLIRKVVPEQNSLSPRFKRGAPFEFAGDIAEDFFGTATQEDLERVSGKLKAINTLTANNAKAITTLQNDYLSFVNVTKAQFGAVWTQLEHTNEFSKALAAEINQNHEVISSLQWVQNMMLILSYDILANRNVEDDVLLNMARFQRGLMALNDGRLSAELISPEVLQQSLDDISHSLESKYNGLWTLVNTRASDYYKKKTIAYSRKNNQILATVPVAIQSTGSVFRLFKVHTWSVSLNQSTSNATLVRNVADFIAIDESERYYVLLSNSDINACNRIDNLYRCSHVASATHFDQKSCTSALWQDDVTFIKKLCKFHYSPYSLQERVVNLEGTNQVFITSNETVWHEVCANKAPRRIQSCKNCKLTLKCQCSYYSKSWRIPERLSDCASDSDNTANVMMHTVNFGMLANFDSPSLKQISAATEYAHKPLINLPDLKLSENKLDHVVKTAKQFDVDMGKLMTNAVAHKTSFRATTDALLEAQALDDVDDYSSVWWLKYVLAAVFGVLTLGFIFLFYKQRLQGVALFALQSQNMVHGATVPVDTKVSGGLRNTNNDNIESNEVLPKNGFNEDDFIRQFHSHVRPLIPKSMNYSDVAVMQNDDLEDIDEWYNAHHTRPGSLIVYLVGVCIFIYIFYRIVKFFLTRMTTFRYRYSKPSCKIVLCLRGQSKSAYIELAGLPGLLAYDVMKASPINLENLHYSRKSCCTGQIVLTWTQESIVRARFHNIWLPTSVNIQLPMFSHFPVICREFLSAQVYVEDSKFLIPLTPNLDNPDPGRVYRPSGHELIPHLDLASADDSSDKYKRGKKSKRYRPGVYNELSVARGDDSPPNYENYRAMQRRLDELEGTPKRPSAPDSSRRALFSADSPSDPAYRRLERDWRRTGQEGEFIGASPL